MTISEQTPPNEIVELTDDFYQDPHAVYRALRPHGPLHRVRLEGVLGWLIVDYDVAKQALLEPSISKRIGSAEGQAVLAKNGAAEMFSTAINDNMLFADPPQHTRLRRLVAKAFASRAVADLDQRITELTDTLLADILVDGAVADGDAPVDLIDRFAFPLPIAVICELLGVPDEDKAEFRSWTATVVTDTATIEDRTAAGIAFFTYMTELIAKRTEEPRADLLSELIIAKDDGDRLDQSELIGMLFLLLTAGHETTVNLIGNALLELLRHPVLAQRLRTDPTGIPAFLEEVLRCHGSLQFGTARFTTAPIELGGKHIGEGEFILISLAAANRDPRHFEDPDRLDPQRAVGRHLSFGHGMHYCLGASLARREATIAITQLLAKLPSLCLVGEFEELRWRKSILIRGLTELPVRLAAKPAERAVAR